MIKPRVRKKIPECDRCQFYSHDPHLVCAVHPSGPGGDSCLDFREDPSAEVEELWEPQGARYIDDELVIERTYYNGEEIRQPPQQWSQEQQLWLLDNHPLFTGKCPQCGAAMNRDYTARVHWDCDCGWMDDSV
ncbi:MAG: hypothetical protein QNJ63_09900 [Calothrix sp. MO_192.B10]|nr:hypothetical protein [Calothrix sp. MO_192.B10]